jgi:hypothetical protein
MNRRGFFCLKTAFPDFRDVGIRHILRGPIFSFHNQNPPLKDFILLKIHPNVIDATWHIEV